MNNIVSLEYLNDYDAEALKQAVNLGIERLNLKQFFKPKMKVLIKICMPHAVSQDMAESTNPAIIKAIVDCLNAYGVECVVAESPYGKYSDSNLSSVYLNTGVLEMANVTKCELNHNLATTKIEVANGVKTKDLTILDVVNNVDAIINVGKIKIDDKLGFLGACANLFGLVPGELKTLIMNRFTCLEDWNEYIIDIIEALKSKMVLNVLDGIVALEANKTQRMLNCLAMSNDVYALDSVICEILNINAENTILKQANTRELFDFKKSPKVVGEKIEKFKLEDFALVDFDNLTLINKANGYFKTHQQRVVIDKSKCKGCKICSKICPTKAILMKYDNNNELYAEIDYKKCIYCNKCITACPYSVVQQKTPLAYKKLMKEITRYNKNQSN